MGYVFSVPSQSQIWDVTSSFIKIDCDLKYAAAQQLHLQNTSQRQGFLWSAVKSGWSKTHLKHTLNMA